MSSKYVDSNAGGQTPQAGTEGGRQSRRTIKILFLCDVGMESSLIAGKHFRELLERTPDLPFSAEVEWYGASHRDFPDIVEGKKPLKVNPDIFFVPDYLVPVSGGALAGATIVLEDLRSRAIRQRPEILDVGLRFSSERDQAAHEELLRQLVRKETELINRDVGDRITQIRPKDQGTG